MNVTIEVTRALVRFANKNGIITVVQHNGGGDLYNLGLHLIEFLSKTKLDVLCPFVQHAMLKGPYVNSINDLAMHYILVTRLKKNSNHQLIWGTRIGIRRPTAEANGFDYVYDIISDEDENRPSEPILPSLIVIAWQRIDDGFVCMFNGEASGFLDWMNNFFSKKTRNKNHY